MSTGLAPVRPIFFHGKTWDRIHLIKPAFSTYSIMVSPQRFLTVVNGVEKTPATEDDGGNDVGMAVGGKTTATSKATAEMIAHVAWRGDEAGAV